MEREPELAADATTVPPAPAPSGRSALVVRAGGLRVALGIDVARRVAPMTAVHRVPHRGHSAFLGVASVDGELVPVSRLDRMLGVVEAEMDAPGRRLVLCGADGRLWALLVDGVEGLCRLAAPTTPAIGTVGDPLEALAASIVACEDGRGTVHLLDADALRTALERTAA